MYPRPLFYPQPHSIGITLPKEMEGNAGLKTAIPSNVFVTVHSSTYPLPATNIILLQQASRAEGGKPWRVYCLGRFLWCKRNPETRPDSSCVEKNKKKALKVKGKVPSLCNCLWDIHAHRRRAWPSSQSRGPYSSLGVKPALYKHVHPRVYLRQLNIGLFIFWSDM